MRFRKRLKASPGDILSYEKASPAPGATTRHLGPGPKDRHPSSESANAYPDSGLRGTHPIRSSTKARSGPDFRGTFTQDVVLLAGGTGGAKLARGLLDVVDPNQLTVVANTGDDIVLHGLHISPDPDLVTYWLADAIDQRLGWGFAGDTFASLDQLKRYDACDTWFKLGDRDLATHIFRTDLMRSGARLTEAAEAVARALGVKARVLPMSDDPVATHVRTNGKWLHFQEFMIKEQGSTVPEQVEFRDAESASPTPEVMEALEHATVVLIGPSNPIASIGPIMALEGIRDTLVRKPAVAALSPLVEGRSLKGPTVEFMTSAGLEISHAGVAEAYAGIIDGMVCDPHTRKPDDIQVIECDTEMADPAARRQVAWKFLQFASTISANCQHS